MKAVFVAFVLAAAVIEAQNYDPVRLLPDSYSLQFENDWVKVVRVRYAPHAKLPAHAHTSRASAYVYLTDGGPVVFRHVGDKAFAATRPATRAGSFRVFRGLEEIHEVENTSDLPSEFLRVEFKTDPKDAAMLRGRFHREPVAAGGSLEKVQFENGQVRISRLVYAPGQTARVAAAESEPVLMIALTPIPRQRVTLGQEIWIPAGQAHTVQNLESESVEMLRFDFKTSPLGRRTDR